LVYCTNKNLATLTWSAASFVLRPPQPEVKESMFRPSHLAFQAALQMDFMPLKNLIEYDIKN
jgi:hypothetical protein